MDFKVILAGVLGHFICQTEIGTLKSLCSDLEKIT